MLPVTPGLTVWYHKVSLGFGSDHYMKCPACGNDLTATVIDNATVDLCKDGCGGGWFDQFELKKVNKPGESASDKLIELQRSSSMHPVDQVKRRNCPRCTGIVMMRHYFSVKREVLVDECAGCGGIWLDAGELEQIRNEFSSEEERQAATQQYISSVLEPHIAVSKLQSDAGYEKYQWLRGLLGKRKPQ
jgi:uncharacterized protein